MREETRAAAEIGAQIKSKRTMDSYANFMAKLGIGQDNLSSGGTYGFNPITRQRTLLEWIHRGSWIGGVAIDVVADDMTRAGVDIIGPLKPEQKSVLEETVERLDIWGALNDTIKWSRLYGGAIAVHLTDQDYSTPLRIDTIGKDQYKGMLVLDRWQVMPSVEDLITQEGPFMGLPKYYTVGVNAPGLRGKKVHYTRVIRMEGVRLPYQQRVTENLWGESELERVYDRLLAFDSSTTGAAQLVYKCYLRVVRINELRDVVSNGGVALEGLVKQMEMMRLYQSMEGITLLDKEDEFEEGGSASTYTGLAELLIHFGQQLSGALQIPLTRLFGQSPAGLNSTGESDLRNYYDGINQRQNRTLKFGVLQTYRMIAASEGIKPPKGYGISFKPLWQLTEKEKADIAETDTRTVTAAIDGGVAIPAQGARELRRSSSVTGRWSSIDDGYIAKLDEMDAAPAPTQVEAAEVKEGEEPGAEPKGGTAKA